MFKALKRWWARKSHVHEWIAIWRGSVSMQYNHLPEGRREPLVLERCTCAVERVRRWNGQAWVEMDLDWFNDQAARANFEIGARHQE